MSSNKNIEISDKNENKSKKILQMDNDNIQKKRVDINILKSKLHEEENKEFKKNLFLITSLLFGLGSLTVYLSM
ncbi:MAG: hypothetical protein CBD92_001760 [Pelagibacteraceae bacterium TMED232]|mgnify:CR=1 FL=1|nr:MAG: hypothetical protein CBD92_001760 [Pelagibacteraceae bacterium TMED232]|tara:strand:- start:2615 stop:2836 length:222 start_codon:yes stop_codon:yes gene_type:complete